MTDPQPLSAADVIARAKPRTARCSVLLDGELVDRHEALAEQLDGLDVGSDAARHIAEQIAELETEIANSEVEFVFRGMGHGRYRALIAKHPPSIEERMIGLEFSPDSFHVAAIVATLTEPSMTEHEVQSLLASVGEMGFAVLWGTCLQANVGGGSTRPSSDAARAILQEGPR